METIISSASIIYLPKFLRLQATKATYDLKCLYRSFKTALFDDGSEIISLGSFFSGCSFASLQAGSDQNSSQLFLLVFLI